MAIYTRPEGAEPGASILERLRRTMEPIVNWDRERAPGLDGGPSYPPGPSGGPWDVPPPNWVGPPVRVPPGPARERAPGFGGGPSYPPGGVPPVDTLPPGGGGGPLDWLRRRFEDAGGLAGLAAGVAGARGGSLGRVLEGDFSRPSSWDDPKPQRWSPQSTNRRNWTSLAPEAPESPFMQGDVQGYAGEKGQLPPFSVGRAQLAPLVDNMFTEGAGEQRYRQPGYEGSAYDDLRPGQDDYLRQLTTSARSNAARGAQPVPNAKGEYPEFRATPFRYSDPNRTVNRDPETTDPVRYDAQGRPLQSVGNQFDQPRTYAAGGQPAQPAPAPAPGPSAPAPATDFQSRLAAMPPGGILEHVSDTPLDADAARRAGYLLVDRQGRRLNGVIPPGTPVLIVRDAGAGTAAPSTPAPGPPPAPRPSTPATYPTGTVYDADGKVIFRGRINQSGTPSNDEDVYDVNPYNRPGSRVELD